jgi:hypothetical protein
MDARAPRIMKRHERAWLAASAALAAWIGAGIALGAPGPAPAPAPRHPAAPARACLPLGGEYLRARIRGAVNLDLDLRGDRLRCEGGPRPGGGGIVMSFEGRLPGGGERLTLVFGIAGAREGRPGRELPTNLTVIFGQGRALFATQGAHNCTVDRLEQQRIGPRAGATRGYRLVARGFCIAPANDLAGRRRILVTRFDFAGRATFKGAAHAHERS